MSTTQYGCVRTHIFQTLPHVRVSMHKESLPRLTEKHPLQYSRQRTRSLAFRHPAPRTGPEQPRFRRRPPMGRAMRISSRCALVNQPLIAPI